MKYILLIIGSRIISNLISKKTNETTYTIVGLSGRKLSYSNAVDYAKEHKLLVSLSILCDFCPVINVLSSIYTRIRMRKNPDHVVNIMNRLGLLVPMTEDEKEMFKENPCQKTMSKIMGNDVIFKRKETKIVSDNAGMSLITYKRRPDTNEIRICKVIGPLTSASKEEQLKALIPTLYTKEKAFEIWPDLFKNDDSILPISDFKEEEPSFAIIDDDSSVDKSLLGTEKGEKISKNFEHLLDEYYFRQIQNYDMNHEDDTPKKPYTR